jgi:hypothetical protein
MKKIILIMLIAFTGFIVQSCDNDKTESKDSKAVDVPAAVQSAFSAKYSTATDIKWEDAHEDAKKTFKAKFMVDGKKMKAEFDESGAIVKEEEDK